MESRICSRGSCLGMRIEKGCQIFAVINAIVVSTCLAGCLCYIGWLCDVQLNKERHRDIDGLEIALNMILCIILTVCSGVSFIFAVLLCHGAYKKKPAFLMAYFVFGVLVEVLSIGGAIAYVVINYDSSEDNTERALVCAGVMLICVLYAFLLALVYRTFFILSSNTILSSGHKKLIYSYPVL